MYPIASRTLLLAGLTIVLIFFVALGFAWTLWSLPTEFEVKGFWVQ
jgi:hypothetical protein